MALNEMKNGASMWLMIRLYLLVIRFLRFPHDGFWATANEPLSRSKFSMYLQFEKPFSEDWRETFYRISRMNSHKNATRPKRQKRIAAQKKRIEDTIDKAIELGYLTIDEGKSRGYEIYLRSNWKTRDFIKPLNFIEACAKQYGYLASCLATFFFSVGGTVLLIFWSKIINWLAKP